MGLTEDVQELKELMLAKEVKEKEKKFRFPFGKKVGRTQRTKNYVTILLLYENSTYIFKKYQIENQTILHDLIPRLATKGHVMHDKKGNPLIILPNWDVEPFSPLEHYEKSMINGSNKKGFKILMDRMLGETITGKKKVGKIVPWIVGIILAVIIGYAFITGGGT